MRYRLSILLTAVSLFSACAVLDVEAITPDPPANRAAPSMQSLRVQPVADTPKKKRGASPVSGKMFREAVVLAFRNANLFQSVVTEGDTNLTLEITLVQQLHIPVGGWEMRHETIADYVLTDQSGRSVWQDTIRTVAGSTAIGGGRSVVESSERSTRENVGALVRVAGEQWPGVSQ